MKSTAIKNVTIAIGLADASWRDFLTGFFAYTKTNVHWNIRLAQSINTSTGEGLADLLDEDADGFVVGVDGNESLWGVLKTSVKPIVVIGTDFHDRRTIPPRIAFIRNDNEDIGRLGAIHLRSLGNFASYGFVSTPVATDWSKMREDGFMGIVSTTHSKCFAFHWEGDKNKGSNAEKLARWLAELPKPSGIMAACDKVAISILEACQKTGIPVPGQVAVVGVDNDRLLCDLATPPLTSIAPDHEYEGILAAKTLEKLMRPKCRATGKILISRKTVVKRESSVPIAPAASLIRRALDIIDRHSREDIRSPDIAKALGVSRSLLELRFREYHCKTVAKAILDRRLEEVCRQLSETDIPIQNISTGCGYTNTNHLMNIFKRHIGMTMREYRRSAKLQTKSKTHRLADISST